MPSARAHRPRHTSFHFSKAPMSSRVMLSKSVDLSPLCAVGRGELGSAGLPGAAALAATSPCTS
eukprot:8873884-Pyramimonas_sp.AAC.1